MMKAVTAKISVPRQAAPAASPAAAPQPLVPLASRLAGPHRMPSLLRAFSMYAVEEPQGPFSFWPRQAEQAKVKAPTPPSKKGNKPAVNAEPSEEASPLIPGKQRFRSALEQVSFYTNDSAYNRS